MKFYNRFSLVLAVLFLVSLCGTSISAANQSPSFESEEIDIKAQMALQEDALDAYNDILAELRAGNISDDIYAGAYINGDDIVIMLTDISDSNKRAVLDSTDKPHAVAFEEATYSLNELDTYLSDTLDTLSDYSITEYGFYEADNKCFVKVEATQYNQAVENIPSTYALSDSPVLIESGTYDIPSAQLIGGMSESTQTLGFCGRYGVYDAVITTGHGASVGETVDHGSVIHSQFEDGEYGDYAIILLDDGHTMTNKVYGSSGTINISTVYSNTPVNTIVYGYGKNTGHRTGTVTATNLTVTYASNDGIKIKGLIRCSPVDDTLPVGGDSGGPIYRTAGSLYAACGIQTTVSASTSTWTFCPFEHIAAMFAPLTSAS